jgi:hypothetical protein
MEKPTVYVASTIPSYLVAEPSRDIVVAGHQRTTHDWWTTAGERFDLLISELVFQELAGGNQTLAVKRLAAVRDLPVLGTNSEVNELVLTYEQQLGLTGKARGDVPHFAFCVAYEIHYLVTWNCAHLANAIVLRRLHDVNLRLGLWMPVVCTPEELMFDPEKQG